MLHARQGERAKRGVSEYLDTELASYGSYDLVRKLPNFVDGLKMSQRKVVYTLMKKYPRGEFVKTETLANVTAAFTNYLHGAGNIAGPVCTTMTQGFVGANNYPLTRGNSGGFGCRINPNAAAPRYTRVALSDTARSVFLAEDEEVVGRQYFEGDLIEPRFFAPVFPVLFLNGASGLSTGFNSAVHPRRPSEVVKYLRARLAGTDPDCDLRPWFRGFKGEVRPAKGGGWESVGVAERANSTRVCITELPIGTEYAKYIEFLDKLSEENAISGYEDRCEPKTDTIEFIVRFDRDRLAEMDGAALESFLHLRKALPEILNCIDTENRVREFSSAEEVLDAYMAVRMDFYGRRREHILARDGERLRVLRSRLSFCEGVVDGSVRVARVPKSEIEAALDARDGVERVDGSYDYLLKMPVLQLTEERVAALKDEIAALEASLAALRDTTPTQMWLSDLDSWTPPQES